MGLYRLRLTERINRGDVKRATTDDSIQNMISGFSILCLNIDQYFRVEIPNREEWTTSWVGVKSSNFVDKEDLISIFYL